MEEKELKVFKILILGDSGTGKTSVVRQSVHAFFTDGYRSTIGVDFSLKVLQWTDELEIRLQVSSLQIDSRNFTEKMLNSTSPLKSLKSIVLLFRFPLRE